MWNKFWHYYWNKKLDKFLLKHQDIPFYYLQYSIQFMKIYYKKEYYKNKL